MENQAETSAKPNLADEFMKTFDLNLYIERTKAIAFDPLGTWPKVKEEATDVKQMYLQYIFVIALLPGLAEFIGLSVLGPLPILTGLKMLLWRLVSTCAGAYLFAMLTMRLAPSFGGSATMVDGLKWIVMPQLPVAAVSVLMVIPLSFLTMLVGLAVIVTAIYALYILWLGVPIMLGIPDDKRVAFFISTVACCFVIGAVAAWIAGNAGLL